MTDPVQAIRNEVKPGCIVDRDKEVLEKEYKCTIGLSGMPEYRVVIDFDHKDSPLRKDDARCDYLIIAKCNEREYWVIPLEVKSGKLRNVRKPVSQLRAGIEFFESLLNGIAGQFKLLPIIASRGVDPDAFNKLKRPEHRLKLRSKKKRQAQIMRCNTKVINVLNKY